MRALFALSNLVTAGKVTWKLPHHVVVRVEKYVVTRDDVVEHLPTVVQLSNEIGGPQVRYDKKRGCYGLTADRDYGAGEVVTEYGGSTGFELKQKGRWIVTQSKCANVRVARKVRTLVPVSKGDWFFAGVESRQ